MHIVLNVRCCFDLSLICILPFGATGLRWERVSKDSVFVQFFSRFQMASYFIVEQSETFVCLNNIRALINDFILPKKLF